MSRLNVVLLFGGKSTEHEVSVRSAKSIYDSLDKTKYNVRPVAISKRGVWLQGPEVQRALETNTAVLDAAEKITLLPDPNSRGLVSLAASAGNGESQEAISVIIPVLHGRYGEDGTLQGLLEMANVPYVGCGVLSSALGMDKIKQKEICCYHGIPSARFYGFHRARWTTARDAVLSEVLNHFSNTFPVFVKPANTGSSVGVVKVKRKDELGAAIDSALQFDSKVIVEEGLEHIREIEVSVLGNHQAKASVCGEVIPANEFYDYAAKYEDDRSRTVIPADLPASASEDIRALAVKTFEVLECRGLTRVDFFVSKSNPNQFWVNEVNTLPGFTSISMYPKLWEASGVSFPQLVEQLIQLALEEWSEKQKLRTSWT